MAATRKTNTKQAIIDGTLRLIAERTAEEISLSDIAEAADITKGTLFYYYSSKEAIFGDITTQYLNSYADSFESWITDSKKDTSFGRMAKYIIEYGARRDDRQKLHIYLVNKAISGNESLKTMFRTKYAEWRQILSKRIRERVDESVDAVALADLFLLVIDGLIVQDLVGVEDIDIGVLVPLVSVKVK